jgi:hypothetical protein
MTGSRWRLLVFSLILVTSALLRGQNAVAHRLPARAPTWPSSYAPATDSVRLPEAPVAPRPAPGDPIVLPQILQSAGIIFSGRVTSVGGAASPFATDATFTTVTFQVEHSIRGTTAGQNLIIHEWSGLWARGERYRVGERVLLFLYPPSRLGLTSPVAGAVGKFAIDPQGRIVMKAASAETVVTVSYADFARAVKRGIGKEMSLP